MGTLIGHVAPGFGFFLIGFWHLYSHTKLFATGPRKYRSLPWFPFQYWITGNYRFLRHLELYLIMIGCSISVSMELVIGPARHTPFDPDGTIPSDHLHNFEHASISLLFFVYALFALILDLRRRSLRQRHLDVLQLVGGLAFAQQLLLFHLHSADHMGVEGQYHWLLQLVIAVSLGTTLLGVAHPRSFVVSYTRSLSILFQGVWLMLMGFMLWTPSLMPKGCFMHPEKGHKVVRCDGEDSLHRAKSLVNIAFSWFLIGLAIFAASFYMVMMRVYGDDAAAEYYGKLRQVEEDTMMMTTSSTREEDEDEVDDDLEASKQRRKSKDRVAETHSFRHVGMGRSSAAIDHMER